MSGRLNMVIGAMAVAEAKKTPEIEITPAMIEAGKGEIRQYNPDYDDPGDVAVRVYEAMQAASSGAE